MARRAPRVFLSDEGLNQFVDQVEAMPAAVRRAQRRAINEVARATKREISERIALDGISRAKAGGQIQVIAATNRQMVGQVRPTSRRIPFKFWKTVIRPTDETGTRASVWIRKGGELMRVWGFVNPKGKRRAVLTRHRKAGSDRVGPAAGHSIKLHFQTVADQRLRDSVGRELSGAFTKHFNAELKKV